MENTSVSSTEDWPNVCIAVIVSTNLVAFAAQLALSGINVASMLRTSLLHPNLKCVLLCQSAAFCILTFAHIWQICEMFVYGIEHWMGGYVAQVLLIFATACCSLISHVLLIERVIATWMSAKYDRWKTPYFTSIWAILIMVFCVSIVLQQVNSNYGSDSLVTAFSTNLLTVTYFAMGLSFIEVLAFFLVRLQNNKHYKLSLKNNNGQHNLNERYQLLENIRTAHQLVPTFVIYFFSKFISAITIFLLTSKFITNVKLFILINLTYQLLLTFINGLIELSLISRHPILRKNTFHLFSMLKSKLRSFGSNNQVGVLNNQQAIENGQEMQQNETEKHFQMLKSTWN